MRAKIEKKSRRGFRNFVLAFVALPLPFSLSLSLSLSLSVSGLFHLPDAIFAAPSRVSAGMTH